MATENFRSAIQVRQGTGPAGIMTGTYSLTAADVRIGRRGLTGIALRNPWRTGTTNQPVISAASLQIIQDIGDGDSTEIILDALGDPGRATQVGALRTWRIGRPEDVRRFDFALLPVEGGNLEIRECGIVQAQFVVERGQLVSVMSEWEARQITDDHSTWTAQDTSSSTHAGPLTTTVSFGASVLPVFSLSLGISRDLRASNFSQAGVATRWMGRLEPDAIGRIILRVEPGEMQDLLMGGVFERPIEIVMVAGVRTRTFTLPRCVCEASERRLIAPGMYEHQLEFAVLAPEDADAIVITSQTS